MVDVEGALAFKVHRTARLLRRHLAGVTQAIAAELTPEQWFALNRLRRRGPISQVELTDAALDDRPNITRMLTGLEQQGLVRRHQDPEDGRRHTVQLTAKGTRIHDAIAERIPQVRKDVLKGIAARDLEAAHRVLDRLKDNLIRIG
ncbi:MAG: MarR family transcriptional regulator [Myxococcota bacterium]